MKYKNGRDAKVGDQVAGTNKDGRPVVGIVGAIQGARLTINPLRLPVEVDAATCMHVEDIAGDKPAKKAR